MKIAHRRTASLLALFAILCSLLVSTARPFAARASSPPTIDGTIDAEYGPPIAIDPSADLNEPNLDLQELYATSDANNYYIALKSGDIGNYGMEYHLELFTGTVTPSSAPADPYTRALTYDDGFRSFQPSYALIGENNGSGVIGNVNLTHWTGSGWEYPKLVEDRGGAFAYSAANRVIEYRVPKAALGNAAQVFMQAVTTGGCCHAQDSVPSDNDVTWAAPDYGSAVSRLSALAAYPAATRPTLSLTSPSNGNSTSSTTTVAGTVTPAISVVEVRVGTTVYTPTVAMNGTLSQQVNLTAGPNDIAVRARDAGTGLFDVARRSVSYGFAQDNNVNYDGLLHNSQSDVYRVPFGAINPNTRVTLRFRTFHNDVTSVRARFYDTSANNGAGAEFFQDMTPAATNIACGAGRPAGDLCDFWQTQYTPTSLATIYYRFVVSDGTTKAYYDDDNFKDGGVGEAQLGERDNSFVITVFDPAFQPIPWMRDAVIYQIFPDRFRDGNPLNNPDGTTEPRYRYPGEAGAADDQIINKKFDELPEGFCTHYRNPTTPCNEVPRGRDYFGGDLKGVTDKLDYLQALGVTVIYFNPIFESGSNHGYDTQDYKQIDHFFGTKAEYDALVAAANAHGIRLILDGVFNHLSSDSKYFDRYHHYADSVGACESPNSPYRSWFYFRDVAAGTGPCVGSTGVEGGANYDGWFGFDSIPVLNKNNQQVRDLFYAVDAPDQANDSVARYWLRPEQGAAGWRLDVMSDGSFPAEYWQQFRQAVKAVKPDAPILGETWKKDEVLPKIHGDQEDMPMNYRLRNAMLGYFGTVDDKGFADDGQSNEPPSLFARKVMSTREDYPDATFFTAMNIMDSHDTQRILWSLTPGDRNPESKEQNAANLAVGKQMLRLAAMVQMTLPGAPTIYYGDEVALNGDDDPDDRRPFPWTDLEPQLTATPSPVPSATSTTVPGTTSTAVASTTSTSAPGTTSTAVASATSTTTGATRYQIALPLIVRAGGTQANMVAAQSLAAPQDNMPPYYGAGGDHAMLDHYRSLTTIRSTNEVLRNGDLRFLLLNDDASRMMAFGRRNNNTVAIMVVNPSDAFQTLLVPTAGYVRDGVQFTQRFPNNGPQATTSGGMLNVALAPRSGMIWVSNAGQDLAPPAAPTNLNATPGNGQVNLTWTAVADAASYNVYRSQLTGGGYTLIGNTATTSYADNTAANGTRFYYVVKAVDAAGNEGAASNEAAATPSFPINDAYIQLPSTATITLGSANSQTVYIWVKANGHTENTGADPSITAQLGYGAQASDPNTWTWLPAAFGGDKSGGYDEYFATIQPRAAGTYNYLARFSSNGGVSWFYGDQDKTGSDGTVTGSGANNPGVLTVNPSSDTTPPAAPQGVTATNGGPTRVTVAWTTNTESDLFAYNVYRSTTPGGPYTQVSGDILSGTTTYVDTAVTSGTTYYYVVRALDTSFNQSTSSNEASATPAPRNVNVTFNVTVAGDSGITAADDLYITGNPASLLCGFCDPQTVKLTKNSLTSYTITLPNVPEGTRLEYKYTLGSFTFVEKDANCGEIANRTLTVDFGTNSTQTVNDSVPHFRNRGSCPN